MAVVKRVLTPPLCGGKGDGLCQEAFPHAGIPDEQDILFLGYPSKDDGCKKYIPQYAEVPPNIEAKRIISYISPVPSRLSNQLLLKDNFMLMIFLRLLARHLLSHI